MFVSLFTHTHGLCSVLVHLRRERVLQLLIGTIGQQISVKQRNHNYCVELEHAS